MDDDDLAASRQPYPLDLRENRRVDALYFASQLFERALADLLTHRSAIGRDAEQHVAATLIEHCTHGRHGLSARSRRGLEFQR